MSSGNFRDQMKDDGTYALGDSVIVLWTNCGVAYAARGSIEKINAKSILVSLAEDVKHSSGAIYPVGQKISAPRIGAKRWGWDNRVYRPVQGAPMMERV